MVNWKYLFLVVLLVFEGCGSSSGSKDYKSSYSSSYSKNTKTKSAPIAKDDSVVVMQNDTAYINILANDSDKEKDKLEIKEITTPKYGRYKLKGKIIEYIPNKDFIGEDSFKYTIINTKGLTSSASVYIKVIKKANNAPRAAYDSVETWQNMSITIDVLANDSGDKNLTINSVKEPNSGKAYIKDNKIIYTPKRDFVGEDSFEYSVIDSSGYVSRATVYIKVKAKSNNTIALQDDYITINEDTKSTIDALINDGNSTLTITDITSPKYGSAYIEDNKIIYTPKRDYNGKDSFSYSAKDSKNNKATATIYITIKAVNDAPNAVAKVLPINSVKGDEVTLDGSLSSDIDGDSLSFKWLDNGSFLSNSKTFKKSDFSIGEHNITLIVSDGALSSSVLVKITINDNSTKPSTLKKTGQTTKYEDRDDGDYQIGVEFNYNRDDSKEIVTDFVTNLDWQDSIESKNIAKNWSDANSYCSALELGGYSNWRLPTREELFSLIDFSKINSAYSISFKNVTSNSYWTSTTYAKDTNRAWIVYFYDGRLHNEDKNTLLNVRCVRDRD